MPDDPGSIWYVILVLALIGVNAFFAMSEIAIISLNDAKLHHDAENGDKKAKTLCRLVSEPNNFLATIQVAITLAGLLSSAFAADKYADFFTELIMSATGGIIGEAAVHTIVLVILTMILSYVTLVFGELVPKRIAMHYPERIAYSIGGVLSFFYRVFRPFVGLLGASTNGILRLFGINPKEEPESATEENIRMMLDAGNEKGTIEESEKEMINNIFEFDDRTVGEVMTHRMDLTAVELSLPIAEAVDLAISDGYSRMPVYEDTIDNIKGIIYAKDLLALIGEKNFAQRKVSDFLRPVSFIPESNSCREAFFEFQQKKIQIAVVVDEYGGTAGIVSMEDLIESVMGNIQDEYDDEEAEYSRIDEDNFDLEGTMLLDDVAEILNIEFPDELDYDTLGGFITDMLGRIPEESEHPVVTYQNVEFTVIRTEEHRIEKVHAKILLPPEEPEKE
ncbi:MAG: hemolysin family protein [Oscillospiraceae bacterium]|nr:hemolysin family protein [Oscillospiraceae bacterium]